MFNPKHKQDILGKSLENIKKYAHKYHLKKDNLLIIPTNWYYIQESTDNVLEYNSENVVENNSENVIEDVEKL